MIYLFLQVFMPNGRYNGQKPMKEVSTKTNAKIPKINANVPEMILVMYKIPIAAAIKMRIVLSVMPIFFIIIVFVDWLLPDVHFPMCRH